MEGQAVRQSSLQEWQIIPTGKRAEKSIHIYQVEVHPSYPIELDEYSDFDIQKAMEYILREGAPPHRLYVMPNPKKPGFYYIIGWKKVYEAYRLLGITDFIPSLCYFDPEANKKLWKNWQNCPGDIFDVK